MADFQSIPREASFSEYSLGEYSPGEYSLGEYSPGETLIESAVENRSQGQISPITQTFPGDKVAEKVAESEVFQTLPSGALAWSGR